MIYSWQYNSTQTLDLILMFMYFMGLRYLLSKEKLEFVPKVNSYEERSNFIKNSFLSKCDKSVPFFPFAGNSKDFSSFCVRFLRDD